MTRNGSLIIQEDLYTFEADKRKIEAFDEIFGIEK